MEEIRRTESSQLFIDLWKMIKVATNETVFYAIKEIEMKSQQSFSLTKSKMKRRCQNGGVFLRGKK